MVKSLSDHPTVLAAQRLATTWHAGQVRKYTGYPYVTHCERVAALTAMACPDPKVVAAAWLHDVLEDTRCSRGAISNIDEDVLTLVLEVTDVSRPEDGNREVRKKIDRDHLSEASPGGCTIKLADIIDNTMSIGYWDVNFSRTYLKEMTEVLDVLCRGSRDLMEVARMTIRMAEQHLMDVSTMARIERGGFWLD